MGGERHARTQKPTKAAVATLLPLQLCPQVLIEVDSLITRSPLAALHHICFFTCNKSKLLKHHGEAVAQLSEHHFWVATPRFNALHAEPATTVHAIFRSFSLGHS